MLRIKFNTHNSVHLEALIDVALLGMDDVNAVIRLKQASSFLVIELNFYIVMKMQISYHAH